ncbi:50S ribosomal protein L9 [Chlamydiota bacterium]
MKQQLLLLEDVDGLGRSGDVVTAKPGFIRNFLLPQKKAVPADKQTLKMQASLKEEREKRAAVDRKEAESLAVQIKTLVLTAEVKVDPDGKMYGSVSTLDIARLLQGKGYQMDRKNVLLSQAIKTLGSHTVNLRLKEGVPASFTLEVTPEGGILPQKRPPAPEAEAPPPAPAE